MNDIYPGRGTTEPVEPTDTETPPPVQRGAAPYLQQERDNQRDSADMERIRAWWTNNEPMQLVAEFDGDAVAATLATLQAYSEGL